MPSDSLIFSILNRSVISYTSVGCLSLFLRFIIFTIFVRFSIISLSHFFFSLYEDFNFRYIYIFSYWEFLQNSLAIIFYMVCFSVFLSTYTEITLEKYFFVLSFPFLVIFLLQFLIHFNHIKHFYFIFSLTYIEFNLRS